MSETLTCPTPDSTTEAPAEAQPAVDPSLAATLRALEPVFRPPQIVAPRWAIRPMDRFIRHDSSPYGLDTRISFFAPGTQFEVARGPDRVQELARGPLEAAVLAKLNDLEPVGRVRRLQAQITETSKALDVACARRDELLAQRRRLTLEAGPKLAKELQRIDAELERLAPVVEGAEKDLQVLLPEEKQARHDAEAGVTNAVATSANEVRMALKGQRDTLLDNLVAAVSPLLTQLHSLEAAQSALGVIEADARRAALAKLAEGAGPGTK